MATATKSRTTRGSAKTKSNGRVTDPGAFNLDAVPEADRDRVEALIPSKAVIDAYTPRELPGGWSDFDYFDSALRLYHNVLMVGPTGAGKTTAARSYAAHLGVPFVSVEFNGAMDPASTLGTQLVNPETGLPNWLDGEITLGVRYGGVIMLDEVNFAPSRFTAAFHGVLDARQTLYLADLGIRVRKHPGCLVFAAYNDRYRGTNLLNEAFVNRFAYSMDWGYDSAVEQERVGQYSKTLLTVVRKLRDQNEVTTDIGTNSMEEFIHVAHDLNIEAAVWLFLNKLAPEDRAIASKVMEASAPRIEAELGLS